MNLTLYKQKIRIYFHFKEIFKHLKLKNKIYPMDHECKISIKIVEIKNASSKKFNNGRKHAETWRHAERENEHPELWENDFVYIKIINSVSLYSGNRATKWPSQAIQSTNTNMTSGLTN